ncbi:MAG: AAA family ATPase [Candidatus Vogelbacteria bacterium]
MVIPNKKPSKSPPAPGSNNAVGRNKINMRLTALELTGFKSFAKKTKLVFEAPITAVVGPNGSGKSNIAEACRWVLGEQSLKSLRGRRGEDFIWNGSGVGRANRASVSVAFDNHDHKFPLDYDEVTIGREVHRDGTNVYTINGSPVRLRDITTLLNSVAIGASGYHIMSQGEADRILSANGVERRQMIEDALGLKIYQSQIAESERKLEKTQVNLREVELLRREIAPHLRFLKKEMEKIERSQSLRAELKRRCLEYFSAEARYLAEEKQVVEKVSAGPRIKLAEITARLETLARERGRETSDSPLEQQLKKIDQDLEKLARERNEINREVGRLEGQIEAWESVTRPREEEMVSKSAVAVIARELGETLAGASELDDLSKLRAVINKVVALGERLQILSQNSNLNQTKERSEALERLKFEREKLNQKLTTLAVEFSKLKTERTEALQTWEAERETRQGAEREIFELKLKQAECQTERAAVAAREETLARDEARFQAELDEAVLLTDRELLRFAGLAPAGAIPDREQQEANRRQIERLKIQLEDMGVENREVTTEHAQVSERDAFLARETEDLIKSIASLETVLNDLKQKCAVEFDHGLEKISRQFQEFFAILFDGGTASLLLTIDRRSKGEEDEISVEINNGEDENGDQEEIRGVEVSVTLPRKRIKGLEMLSGGERALTSIALLFAMSQVNPPPFLILDETDAALDEANSRRYGEMVATLAQHSQLILITHNRETMSHAGVIYGVTMGADGVSRLLSIKLDQAVEYAKT